MPDSIYQLTQLGQAISGSAYDRWLQEPIFTAFTPKEGPAALALTRADFIDHRFGQHLNAVSRLDKALRKLRVRSLPALQNLPPADLAAVKGVGERQLLSACVVMEVCGVDEADIFRWIDSLHPHRSKEAAAADATRKGKKRRHE